MVSDNIADYRDELDRHIQEIIMQKAMIGSTIPYNECELSKFEIARYYDLGIIKVNTINTLEYMLDVIDGREEVILASQAGDPCVSSWTYARLV